MENLNNDLVFINTLKLLEASIHQTKDVSNIDWSLWPNMKEELSNHAVLPLVSDIVMYAPISEEEKQEITIATAKNICYYHKILKVQSNVFNVLESSGIKATVIKGVAASQYYPCPELRQYGDIDIFVLPKDYKQAYISLCNAGYKANQSFEEHDPNRDCHLCFESKAGIEIEVHCLFFITTNTKEFRVLDDHLYTKLEHRVPIDVNGSIAYVFPTLENGLILFGHLWRHIQVGIGFRHVLDWMEYVDKFVDDSFWDNQMKPYVEMVHLTDFAKTVTKMCQKYLGLRDDITWCKDADDEIVDELMLYIYNRGNFGRKIRNTKSLVSTARSFTSPSKVFEYLSFAGMSHMKEAGLRPNKYLGAIYQVGRIAYKFIKSDKKAKITKEVKDGTKEIEFLKKIGSLK